MLICQLSIFPARNISFELAATRHVSKDSSWLPNQLPCYSTTSAFITLVHLVMSRELHAHDPVPFIEELSDQILVVLNHFRLGSVMCMGAMAGAYVLTLFAIKYSERVNGLILISPICREPSWNEWFYNKKFWDTTRMCLGLLIKTMYRTNTTYNQWPEVDIQFQTDCLLLPTLLSANRRKGLSLFAGKIIGAGSMLRRSSGSLADFDEGKGVGHAICDTTNFKRNICDIVWTDETFLATKKPKQQYPLKRAGLRESTHK
ncbi:pollen-specific protein SF21-like protein [Tanacetum coccineum]